MPWPRERAVAACVLLGVGYLTEQFVFRGTNSHAVLPWFFDFFYSLVAVGGIVFALNSSVFQVEHGRLHIQSVPIPLLFVRSLPMDSVTEFRVSLKRVGGAGTSRRRATQYWLVADLSPERPWRGRTERWLYGFQSRGEATKSLRGGS